MSSIETTADAETTTEPTADEGHPPEDLTAFQRDALRLIEQLGDPHGLAVKDELEELYAKEVNHGRLYPNLDDLVRKGLVEKSQKDRRTNEYEITRRGVRTLDAYRTWLSTE